MTRLQLTLALAALLPAITCAEPAVKALGGHLAYVGNDAGSAADFDNSVFVEGFGQLQFTPHLALELGIGYATGTEDTGTDNTGSYSIDITSTDYFGGVRFDTRSWGALNGYGRGGLLYYRSEIEFAEDFFGLKPGGELEEVEEGIGYFLEGGIAFRLAPGVKLDLGISYRVRQDYFEDSGRPFDMEQLGGTIGLVFAPR